MGNVLISALSENMGGVEEFVLNLSRYKSNDSHEYAYILIGKHSPYEDEMEKKRIKYYKVSPKKNIFKSISDWNKILTQLHTSYEYLYINTSSLGYIIPYLIASSLGYKIILHSHLDASNSSSRIKIIVHRINYRILKKKINKKFACSTPAAKWMFGRDYKESKLIPNAVNLRRFSYDEKDRALERRRLNLKDTDVVIGNVGRLTSLKNQTFLIKLLREINDDSYKLVLVGDGEDKEQLVQLSKEYNLDQNVIFFGRTDSPEKIMNAFDCIAMPSISEGLPVSLIEAQAAGLLCYVSDKVTREVNVTGQIVFLPIENKNEDIEIWCREIKKNNNYFRKDNYETLKKNGYDVNDLEQTVWNQIHNLK